MLNNKKIGFYLGLVAGLILPTVAWAALVTCGRGAEPCQWSDLITLIDTIIKFLIFSLGVPLAILAIIIGGIMLVIGRDSAAARSAWKDRIWKAIVGLIIMLAAYLIVKVIVLGLTGDTGGFYKLNTWFN